MSKCFLFIRCLYSITYIVSYPIVSGVRSFSPLGYGGRRKTNVTKAHPTLDERARGSVQGSGHAKLFYSDTPSSNSMHVYPNQKDSVFTVTQQCIVTYNSWRGQAILFKINLARAFLPESFLP